MHSAQGSTLRVVSLPSDVSYALFTSRPVALARPHPLLPGHVGVVDSHGLYYVLKLAEGSSRASVVAVYELQLCADGDSGGGGFTQPMRKEWRAFEHLADDGLVLCHRGSGRILFAQLPLCVGEHGAVFLFGVHDGPVLSLAANRELLLSGGADGCMRLWNLDNGALVDCCRRHAAASGRITTVAFVGSLMIAAGTDQGSVSLYDISSSRLQAVQRFHAGEGPVTALASRLTPRQAHDVVTASAPRGLDGGGVVGAPVGLPWRSSPSGRAGSGTETLLAVASPAGWLHVYRAARSGEDAWQLAHRGAVAGEPFLSYSPDGNYLAVGSGACLEVLDASTLQVVYEQRFLLGPLAGAGFLLAATGGSALVAMPLGGTLAGGIRLRLYAAPAGEEPVLLQMTVPLVEPGSGRGQRDAEAAADEDFLSWLERTAAAPSDAAVATAGPAAVAAAELFGLSLDSPSLGGHGPPQLHRGTSPSTRNPAWGWQAFAPSAGSAAQSPGGDFLVGTQLHGSSLDEGLGAADGATGPEGRRPSGRQPWGGAAAAPAPLAAARHSPGAGRGSPHLLSPATGRGVGLPGSGTSEQPRLSLSSTGATTRGSEARPGEAADPAGCPTWQAYRPATQPAPRSWLTGLPPRADFLPQPMSPQQLQPPIYQQQRGTVAPAIGSTLGGPTATGHAAPSLASHADGRWAAGVAGVRAAGPPVVGSDRRSAHRVASSPAKDEGEDATDGFLEAEPELPHSGALLPTARIAAVSSVAMGSAGRYGAEAEDGDDDEGALLAGEAARQQQAPAPAPGLRNQGMWSPAGGPHEWASAPLAAASGGPAPEAEVEVDQAGQPAVEFVGADVDEGVEVAEYSFARAGWGQPGGDGLGGAGAAASGYATAGGAAGQGRGQAAWRRGDAELAVEDFRPSASTSAATRGDGAVIRGGSLGDSFHFQPPGRQMDTPEQEGQQQQREEPADPLGRTAYFGDALIKVLQEGSGAGSELYERSGAGAVARVELVEGTEVDDETREEIQAARPARPQPQPHRQAAWQLPEVAAPWAAESSGGGGGAGAGSAGRPAEGDLWAPHGHRKEQEEEEEEQENEEEEEEQENEEEEEEGDLLPRGPARLPAPQPEWSQQQRPVNRHQQLQHQQLQLQDFIPQPQPGMAAPTWGAAAAENGIAGDTAAPSPSESGRRSREALEAHGGGLQPSGEQPGGGEQLMTGGGDQHEPEWSDWANSDLLSGAAGARKGRQGPAPGLKGPPGLRPAPQPRQPPPAVADRIVLSSPAAAAGSVASAAMETNVAVGQRPALSVFRGFKHNHAKMLQQLRKKSQVPGAARDASEPPGPPLGGQAAGAGYESNGDGDGGYEATAESGVAAQGRPSSPPSILHSSSVLLGSPNASTTTATSAPGRGPGGVGYLAALLEPHHPAAQLGPVAAAEATSRAGSRQGLQRLRQLRHTQHRHQLLLRQGNEASGTRGASAATPQETSQGPAPSRPLPSSKHATAPGTASGNRQAGKGLLKASRGAAAAPPAAAPKPSWRTPTDGSDAAYTTTIEAIEFVEESAEEIDEQQQQQQQGWKQGEQAKAASSPLQVPQLGSSALLLRKMQTLGQALMRPAPTVARGRPRSRGRGRGGAGVVVGAGGAAVLDEDEVVVEVEVMMGTMDARVAGVNEAALEEASRRAATSAANVPPAAQLYRDLPSLEDSGQQHPHQAARLAKQVHPAWVASRQVKPELATLWRPADHAREVCNTRGVFLYVAPSTAEVALNTLSLQWLC